MAVPPPPQPMTLRLTLAVAALALASSSLALQSSATPTPGNWNDLFVLDCSGAVYAAPTQSLLSVGGDLAILRPIWDFVVQAYQSRVQCHCPSLTPAQMDEYFGGSFRTVLEWLEPKPKTTTAPPLPNCQTPETRFFATNQKPGESFDFVLPSTCSSVRWAMGLPCLLSMPFGPSGANLTLAVAQCPDRSNVPYISLSCAGAACSDLGRPCASSADCDNGHACTTVDNKGTLDFSKIVGWLHDGAVTAGLFADTDSCATPQGDDITDSVLGSWLFAELSQLLTPYFSGGQAPASSATLCNVQWIADGGTPYQSCTKSSLPGGVTQYDCETTPWDGTLNDGTSALAPARMARYGYDANLQPTVHPLPVDPSGNGVTNMGVYTCDDRFGWMVGDPLLRGRFWTPPLHALYSGAYDIVTRLAQCRSRVRGGTPLTAAQIESRWNLASALPYLANFTLHNAFPPGMSMTDLFAYQYSVWFGDGYSLENANYFVDMPEGCTLSDWLTTGECRAEFTGFKELLGQDVTVRVRLQKCAAGPAMWNTTIDCVGKGCAAVLQPYVWEYCSQDSDCTGGRTCTDLPSISPQVAPQLWLNWEWVSQPIVTLMAPTSNPSLFRSMSFAAQQVMARHLAADLAEMVNIEMVRTRCGWGQPCVNQTAAQFMLSGLTLNPDGTQLRVTYVLLPGSGMTTQRTQNYLSYFLSQKLNFNQSQWQWGQYAATSSTSGSMYIYYVQCPDGSWQTDVAYCTPQDTCDPAGQLQIDLINLMLTLRKQPLKHGLSPNGVHGFCSLPIQNVTNFEDWSANVWNPSELPNGNVLGTIRGLAPFQAPDPNDPNCFDPCKSAAHTRTAAFTPLALALTLVAAFATALVSTRST